MRYKNISKFKQFLIGLGKVEPNGVIETETLLNNANFQEVKKPKEVEKVGIKTKEK